MNLPHGPLGLWEQNEARNPHSSARRPGTVSPSTEPLAHLDLEFVMAVQPACPYDRLPVESVLRYISKGNWTSMCFIMASGSSHSVFCHLIREFHLTPHQGTIADPEADPRAAAKDDQEVSYQLWRAQGIRNVAGGFGTGQEYHHCPPERVRPIRTYKLDPMWSEASLLNLNRVSQPRVQQCEPKLWTSMRVSAKPERYTRGRRYVVKRAALLGSPLMVGAC